MEEVVRYTYRLRPGAQAEAALIAEWHRCRWLWNEAVDQMRTGRITSLARLGKLLTAARSESAWLRAGSQDAQQQVLRDFTTAVNGASTVKGKRQPKAKTRKRSRPSLAYSCNGFKVESGRLRLPKGTVIPVVWHRALPSEPTSVRVCRSTDGHWYASFVVRREAEIAPAAEEVIGIDWGVSATATTTDPTYDLPHSRHRRTAAVDLAAAQRRMARRHRTNGPQSKGYRRARRQAALIQRRSARRVQHEARVWAKRVVDAHGLIAVEDFKPTFLARSTMARSAADAAIGATKRELIERATRAGRKVVMVQPAYTTMTCAECFARTKQRLELRERTFRCECGHTADRDRNAARVILAVAERGHTRVDDVRRPDDLPVERAQSERGSTAA